MSTVYIYGFSLYIHHEEHLQEQLRQRPTETLLTMLDYSQRRKQKAEEQKNFESRRANSSAASGDVLNGVLLYRRPLYSLAELHVRDRFLHDSLEQ